DTADIVIIHGSRVESYRGVQLAAGGNFIDTRLAKSELVQVQPSGGAYPASFTKGSQTIAAMTLPSAFTSTMFNAGDFDAVFAPDSSLDKVDIFNILCVPGVADTGVWGN